MAAIAPALDCSNQFIPVGRNRIVFRNRNPQSFESLKCLRVGVLMLGCAFLLGSDKFVERNHERSLGSFTAVLQFECARRCVASVLKERIAIGQALLINIGKGLAGHKDLAAHHHVCLFAQLERHPLHRSQIDTHVFARDAIASS